MAKFIYIEGDENDGDYIGKFSEISDEDLALISPLLDEIIKKEDGRNYDTTPYRCMGPREMYPQFSDNVHDTLSDYIPYGENGIHDITEVRIIEGKESEI